MGVQRQNDDATLTRPKRSTRQPLRFKDFQQGTLRPTPADSPSEPQTCGNAPGTAGTDPGAAAAEPDQAQPPRKRRLVRLSHMEEAPQQPQEDAAAATLATEVEPEIAAQKAQPAAPCRDQMLAASAKADDDPAKEAHEQVRVKSCFVEKCALYPNASLKSCLYTG